MHNAPPPGDPRPRHPLERDPAPAAPPGDPAATPNPRRAVLHIPVVPARVTWIIIIINVLIFLVRALSRQIDFDLLLWGANQPLAVLQNGEAYRLFTSMFLHASINTPGGGLAVSGILHIFFNMFILYTEGSRTEQMFGHARFAAVYLIGGLTGSVLSAMLNLPVDTYSLGASGAVFAVLGARLVFLYRHRKLFGVNGRAEMSRVGQLLVLNLIIGLLSAFGGGALGRIDNWAHLGGAIGGAALAWVIGPFFVFRMQPGDPPHVHAEDVNPLRLHYRDLVLFGVALMGLLVLGRLLMGM